MQVCAYLLKKLAGDKSPNPKFANRVDGCAVKPLTNQNFLYYYLICFMLKFSKKIRG